MEDRQRQRLGRKGGRMYRSQKRAEERNVVHWPCLTYLVKPLLILSWMKFRRTEIFWFWFSKTAIYLAKLPGHGVFVWG